MTATQGHRGTTVSRSRHREGRTSKATASGQPAHYELFDHLWLTPDLQAAQTSAHIDRRTRLGGDGSDHDPAWIVLDI